MQVRATETGLAEFSKSYSSMLTEETTTKEEMKEEENTGGYNVDNGVCKLCDGNHFNINVELLKCKPFLVMSPKERLVSAQQKDMSPMLKWRNSVG